MTTRICSASSQRTFRRTQRPLEKEARELSPLTNDNLHPRIMSPRPFLLQFYVGSTYDAHAHAHLSSRATIFYNLKVDGRFCKQSCQGGSSSHSSSA